MRRRSCHSASSSLAPPVLLLLCGFETTSAPVVELTEENERSALSRRKISTSDHETSSLNETAVSC